ncbi:shikimate dehydrogenase [Rariglobus hedericola]|uniref:Shikimate dehydrogenase (NADP(+)) n=1 Tax=Rariglobus hedericola TaxID=2597822 RepID=A0A556QGL8_9BACT|nr:shikimate dehydrogenase [Rariglobus hedericola]TSJ75761.1 shikimate dehydrogenase [Rariglobus hedericola]
MLTDPIYTLADLDNWSFAGTALAVLGHPIKHSISPPMHNAALAQMAQSDARFASWKYFRFDIAPDDLPVALEKFSHHNFKGLNLTVPHKVLAFDLVNTSGTDAHEIGAVNTLTLESNSWFGENTDGYGLEAGILENFRTTIADRDIILLGAGGAARGAAVMCVHRHCRSLWIANRTAKNRDALQEHLLGASWHLKVPVFGFDPSAPPKELPLGALVINATSAGLKPNDPLPIDLSTLPRPRAVYDMIYNPPETPLLAQARALGIPAANGLSMLVHQGARALEIWSEAAVPVDAMRSAVHSAMKSSA